MSPEQEIAKLREMLTMFVQSAYQIEIGNDIWYGSFLIDMANAAHEIGNEEAYNYAHNVIDEINEELKNVC